MTEFETKILGNKKKIIVFGAGIIARAAVLTLRELLENDSRILCCAVTSLNHNPRTVEGVEVRELSELKKCVDDVVVLIAVKDMYYQDVKNILKREGFSEYVQITNNICIDILKERWIKEYETRAIKFINNDYDIKLNAEEYVTFLSRQLIEKKMNFEVNLVDHCNLNCQSCNHFSPIAKECYLDVSEYEKDVERLEHITGGKIGTIMLLGGEPLLHPDITEIIKITREVFVEAEVCVVTNGILLNKMSEEFWKSCSKYDVGILITKYPINLNYSIIEDIAKYHGVKLTYTLDSLVCKTTYKLPLDIGGNENPYQSYAKCYHANKCVVLKKGRLYTCPIAAYVCYFNAYFKKDLPEEDINSVSIYEVESLKEVEDFLKSPISMCKHCRISDYVYDLPWKTSRKEIEEWI